MNFPLGPKILLSAFFSLREKKVGAFCLGKMSAAFILIFDHKYY